MAAMAAHGRRGQAMGSSVEASTMRSQEGSSNRRSDVVSTRARTSIATSQPAPPSLASLANRGRPSIPGVACMQP